MFSPAGVNVTEVTGAAGTGTVTQVGTALTGVGTQFVKECKIGDALSGTLISGSVTAIADATHLTLDASNSGAGAAFTITPVAGVSARVNRVFDQSGLGRHVDQATRSKMGALVASAYAGQPGFSFDGADDIYRNASAFLTGTAGGVFATWLLPSGTIPNAINTLISSADEASTPIYYVTVRNYFTNATPKMEIGQANNDTDDSVDGSTSILAATRYISCHISNGTAYSMRLNKGAETMAVRGGANNGDWWGDVPNMDSVIIGALKTLNTEQQWFRGTLLDLCVLDGVIPTTAQCQQYENWAASIWP